MKQSKPLITFVIPCYNYAHFLPETLHSVLDQADDDIEIIVIDDGSTDNTEDVAHQLLRERKNRFQYFYQANQGLSAVRNKGINLAKGEYICFLDSDDKLLEGAISIFKEAIDKNQETDMLVAQYYSAYENGKKKLRGLWQLTKSKEENFKNYILSKDNTFACCSVLYKKHVFDNYKFPEHLRTYEDEPVYAYVLANFTAKNINKPVSLVRKHAESLRHQIYHNLEEQAANEIFNPKRLPEELMSFKDEYLGLKHLDQFRTLFLSGHYDSSWETYKKAFSLNKKMALKSNYARKAIKNWIKK